MTPEQFYDGPVADLVGEAKQRRHANAYEYTLRSVQQWHKDAELLWKDICSFAKDPEGRADKIRADLAEMIAELIYFCERFTDEKDIIARADGIMRPKMCDYANGSDFSHNFRRSAERAGLTIPQVWVVFADKHFGAVSSFCLEGKTESEAIEDRAADLVNYCLLLHGVIEREKLEKVRGGSIGDQVQELFRIVAQQQRDIEALSGGAA